jgi:tetratricopeptide (TPR) repeat protein
MDAAEGYYAAGNCRRQKKDFADADVEFTKALESHPKSAELIYDIGDYAMRRGQPERLRAVVEAAERIAPADPRAKFFRGVGLILRKENAETAEQLLQEYAKRAPKRNGYPSPAMVHVWLGRLYENEDKNAEAAKEFETALRLDPKNKLAQEAVKKIKKG